MGCNFYTLQGKHIGKRSAAGLYCWDCGVSLCKGGFTKVTDLYQRCYRFVHYHGNLWYKKCPKCGQKPQKETVEESAAGRELDFNKSPYRKKTGVKSCSSFSWAMLPHKTAKLLFVKDEYGHIHTIRQFKGMLKECPIQLYYMFDQAFS